MTLTREQVIEQFTAWADAEFGPATGDIPQHERFASYFKAFSAGRDAGLWEAVADELNRIAYEAPISGNTIAQLRVLMAADRIRSVLKGKQ